MREKKGGRRRRRRAHRPPSQTPLDYVCSAIGLHLNAEVRSRTGLDAIARLLFGGAGGGGGVDGDGNDGGGSGNCSSAPPPSVVVPLTATTTTTVTVTTKTWATTLPRGGKGWDDDVRRGDVVHQVSWRAHPGLDCGHDECECDEFRRIVRVGNDDEG